MVLIIKKFYTCFIFLSLLNSLFLPVSAQASGGPEVSAQCAVLSCGGRIIYEKNAEAKMPMASTTKLMTAILALENCGLDEVVEIKAEYCGIEGSSMYLRPGTEKTVEDLLKGLLLVSGNDAAVALACHISGSEAAFAALMNEKAEALGMNSTTFVNPHGLNDPSHYSTAADLARLMEYCVENEDFVRLNAMKNAAVDGMVLVNHNKLLYNCPGCVGGKTGYTMTAGRCLVSCCEREGGRLVCVTLSAPDDWNDHSKLYDWGFERCELVEPGTGQCFTVSVVSGEANEAVLLPEGKAGIFVPKDSVLEYRAELPRFVFAPVEKGERGGKVLVYVDGERAGEYYLIYSDNIALDNSLIGA